MVDGVIISKDKKSAVIHFTTHSVGLYHWYGKVEDLVFWILTGYDSLATMLRLEADTVEIEIERRDAA